MDFFNQSLYTLFVGYIAHVAFDVGDAGFFIVVQSALEGSFVDIVKNDVLYAGGYKRFGDVETNAVRCAGNPCVLTFEREKIHCCDALRLKVYLSRCCWLGYPVSNQN